MQLPKAVLSALVLAVTVTASLNPHPRADLNNDLARRNRITNPPGGDLARRNVITHPGGKDVERRNVITHPGGKDVERRDAIHNKVLKSGGWPLAINSQPDAPSKTPSTAQHSAARQG
jgi:hypothetical protein